MLKLLLAASLIVLLIGGLWLFVGAFFRSEKPRKPSQKRIDADVYSASALNVDHSADTHHTDGGSSHF